MATSCEAHDLYRLLIGGEWVRAGDATEIVNPATEEVIGLAPEASGEQARAAAAAARAAQPAWASLAMEERCRLIGLAVDAVRDVFVRMGRGPIDDANTGYGFAIPDTVDVHENFTTDETTTKIVVRIHASAVDGYRHIDG